MMILSPVYMSTIVRGRHILGGVIKANGVPAKRQVVVFLRSDKSVVASCISNASTGAWQISHINEYPERALFVIAFDHSGEFNAEIADFVSQTVPA